MAGPGHWPSSCPDADPPAAGLAPASADDLADAVRTVFQRSSEMENPVRWTLAAPDPDRVPRPNVPARLAMIRAALHDCVEAADEETTAFLLRSVVLLTSPMAWLYWKDYLGLWTPRRRPRRQDGPSRPSPAPSSSCLGRNGGRRAAPLMRRTRHDVAGLVAGAR